MRAHPAANLRRALISPDYHYLPRLIPLLAFSPQQEVHCSDGVRKGEAGYRKGRQRNPSGQSLLSSHRHKGRTWCSNLTLQRYFGSMQHIALLQHLMRLLPRVHEELLCLSWRR